MVKLLNYTENYLDLLKKVIAVCHNRYTVGDKTLNHVIESGHLSVLEHCYATFEIIVSRKVLAQITRHRHLSFTVQSSRACTLEDCYLLENEEVNKYLEKAMENYHSAIDKGIPYDQASYLLPEGAMCRIVVSGNFRSWLEMLPKRTCKRAIEEFTFVAKEMYQELNKVAPEVFRDSDMMKCHDCNEFSCDFK